MTINHKENLTLLGLISLVLISTIVLVLPKASADDIVTDVSITVPAVCSITTNANNNTEHSAIVDPGTYESNIGKTTIKTICNDAEGFSIYAIGYTNDEYGNTNLKSSLDTTSNVITGTATEGNTSNWAMKLTAGTGTYAPTIGEDTDGSFSDYHKVPSTYTKVATKSSGTDITTGSSIEITYSAYIAGTQPADLYNGKVKFTMVHPSTEPAPRTPLDPGSITYLPNGDNVVGTMGVQEIAIDATSVTLLASNYSRQGYGFAGWSDVADYATNQNAHFYGPNEDITFTAGQYTGTNPGLALYAVWIESAGSLQNLSTVSSVCSSLTQAPTNGTANLASVSALTDERDNQTYAIAKLADGKCWMIENLRLESTAEHNTDGSLAQGYNSSFIGLADAESNSFQVSTKANSLYSIDGSTTKTIDSTGGYLGYRFPRYKNTNTSTRATYTPNQNVTSQSANIYSYGNYYTWHAAIADTTHNGTNNNSSDTTSICPTGWHLPKGGNKSNEANNEFWSLVVMGINSGTNPANYESSTEPYYTGTPEGANASNALRAYPNNFLYSGYISGSSALSRGSMGYYWSSTAYGDLESYFLDLYSSSVSPGPSHGNKNSGTSIRCLAL